MNASHAQQRKPAEPPREGRLLVFPRVSPCEPLCARFGAEVACVPAESCLPHTARDAGIVARSGDGDGKQSVRPTLSDGRRKFCGALPRTR